jgi:PASTA domain
VWWLLISALGVAVVAVVFVGRRLAAVRATVSPPVAAAGSVALVVVGLALVGIGFRGWFQAQEPTELCESSSCFTPVGSPLPRPTVMSPGNGNGADFPTFAPPTTIPTTIPTANPVPRPDDDQDAPTSMPTGGPSGRPPIVVPELRGQSQADAVDALAGLRLRARVQQRADDTPRGQVIGTEPPAGTAVMPGTRVTLFVSNGVVASGDLTVPENTLADLDGGAESEGGEDIWFQAEDQMSRFVAPQNTARIAALGAARPSYELCASASLLAEPIPVDELSAGTVLCVRTTEGRLSVVRLTQLPDPTAPPSPGADPDPAVIELTFTTYRDRE